MSEDVADGELLKAFELSRQKYKTRKQQVGAAQRAQQAMQAHAEDYTQAGGPEQRVLDSHLYPLLRLWYLALVQN